ncbi:hypothetical protein GCM10023193_22060 [Planotetraspora kaengkrachanensis]|uniref:Uncharacterized protein n=1 Tax=Planotetraspora kaengkrachanensis TaxID=575193 RepID=A0A8J3M0Y8_9ACTN|nr:hypothetical protein Pka01_32100 [Planotetraspora kaengkrachanensis]
MNFLGGTANPLDAASAKSVPGGAGGTPLARLRMELGNTCGTNSLVVTLALPPVRQDGRTLPLALRDRSRPPTSGEAVE